MYAYSLLVVVSLGAFNRSSRHRIEPQCRTFVVYTKHRIVPRNSGTAGMPHFAMAVDIGGTFTDVVLRDANGRTFVDKTLTTPKSLDVGFFTAVDAVLQKAGVAPSDVTDVLV